MLDILLINAPVTLNPMGKGTAIPLGLAYIASYLKQKGLRVGALDMSYETYIKEEFKKFLDMTSPKLIGISFTTHSRMHAKTIIGWARETLLGVHITVGGHHATNAPFDTLRSLNIDSIIMGDGEDAMYQLYCEVNTTSYKKLNESVPGLFYKSDIDILEGSQVKPTTGDINSYPWPARDLFNSKQYNLIFPQDVTVNALKIEYLITSRGCPYACRFCSAYLTHGRQGVRYRDINDIISEIDYLMKERDCDGLYIYDDNFIINENRAKEFALEMKKRKIYIPFFCYGRVNSVKLEIFKLLRDVGLQAISFGIESGSERILKYMNKNISNEQTIHAVKICKELGIIAKGTFIVGTPGESVDDLKKTLDLIYELKKIYQKFVASIGTDGMFIYPGTGVYYDALEKGVLPNEFSWFKEYPQIEESLNVPIFVDRESSQTLSKAKYLIKLNKLKFELFHQPSKLAYRVLRKIKRLLN